MIELYVKRFEANKASLRELLRLRHQESYKDLVEKVIKTITSDDHDDLDEKIHQIDDGDYQGTLLFIIPEKGYQPNKYWAVKVSYGSCSGCDTLEDIKDSGDRYKAPDENQLDQYMTLALHIVQGLKEI